MTTKFASYDALTDHIMFAISDAVPGSEFGVSSRSVSRYVEISDEDGENLRRVRISDHDATASCGGHIAKSIDIRDFNIEEIEDECGEFDGIEVLHDWLIDEAITDAIKALSE